MTPKFGFLKLMPIKHIMVSKIMFYHAVAVLPQEVATQLLDLIQTPPAADPEEVLRKRLINLYSLIKALVSLPLTGDQKPSHPTHPEPAISLAVNASDSHMCPVLQQKHQGSWSPLTFFFKKNSTAKSNYSAFHRELLAAYSAVHHSSVPSGGEGIHLVH